MFQIFRAMNTNLKFIDRNQTSSCNNNDVGISGRVSVMHQLPNAVTKRNMFFLLKENQLPKCTLQSSSGSLHMSSSFPIYVQVHFGGTCGLGLGVWVGEIGRAHV